MAKTPRPPWACKEWGSPGHDWVTCPECLDGLEEREQEAAPRKRPCWAQTEKEDE